MQPGTHVARPRRWLAPGAAGLLALVAIALVAGLLQRRRPAPRPLAVRRDGGALIVAPGGDATLGVTEDEAVLHREDGERRIALRTHPCHTGSRTLVGDVTFLYLYPDHEHGLVFGARSNSDGIDLFGHTGRQVSAGCLVDFGSGSVATLADALPTVTLLQESHFHDGLRVLAHGKDRLYAWADDAAVVAHDPVRKESATLVSAPLPAVRQMCRVLDGALLVVACARPDYEHQRPDILVQTFDGSVWPPRAVDSFSLPMKLHDLLRTFELSPDGSRVVYAESKWADRDHLEVTDNFVTVLSLATRAEELSRTDRFQGHLLSVTFDARGRGLLIGDAIGKYGAQGRVRLVSFANALLGTAEDVGMPFDLVAVPSGDRAWFVSGSSAELWPLDLR